jgi:two-component system response regulator AlgR
MNMEQAAGQILRILVVDDEQPARNRLRELLEDCRAEVPHQVVGEAANGLQALALVSDTAPDLALLDIHMPGMTGIELAGHLQLLEKPPAVIFLTAHDQYAVKAFEVNAVDYLLKPVRTARLAAALKKIAGSTMSPEREQGLYARLDPNPRRYLSISERGRVQLVPVTDVMFLKADSKYVTVQTPEREYLIEEPLNRLEEEFGALFVRIHRSCLVARSRIRGFERTAGEDGEGGEGWAVVLEGWPEKLAVSRRQWPIVKTLLRT